jgi:hypothetical protein
VRPLSDNQIERFARKWPLGYPKGKDKDTFLSDLVSTPRIHELARSPLLLVGGLMQYTESNLGIPEARFEYLARVARWLVSDWAAAQGHPPDPYRLVYDRILAKMAFHLHSNQVSECTVQEARDLVKSWLPNFGFDEINSEELLQSVGTKTGILVNEGNDTFVFSQFGLQEYFASLETVENLGIEGVACLQPKDWWREVILLTVAQQRDPTPLLEALFRTDALLATTAVAECPTPPTRMQEEAVRACLAGIDSGDKAISSAVVPLLRRIAGRQESILCLALESRLNEGAEVAASVGLALATAGTGAATAILARHPEIWEKCLSGTGYLSANFENLLMSWIKHGDSSQGQRAAELISTRLSSDRLRELLMLLPNLPEDRADHLASLLLSHIKEIIDNSFEESAGLWMLTRCIPFVIDRKNYLNRANNKGSYDLYGSDDAIATALSLKKRKGKYNSDELLSLLVDSTEWARSQSSILCCELGIVTFLVVLQFGKPEVSILGFFVCLIVFSATFRTRIMPWSPLRLSFSEANIFTNFLLTLSGALYLYASVGRGFSYKGVVVGGGFIGGVGLALCFIVIGLTGYESEELLLRGQIPRSKIWLAGNQSLLASIYVGVIISFATLQIAGKTGMVGRLAIAIISCLYLMALVYLNIRLLISSAIVRRAAKASTVSRLHLQG